MRHLIIGTAALALTSGTASSTEWKLYTGYSLTAYSGAEESISNARLQVNPWEGKAQPIVEETEQKSVVGPFTFVGLSAKRKILEVGLEYGVAVDSQSDSYTRAHIGWQFPAVTAYVFGVDYAQVDYLSRKATTVPEAAQYYHYATPLYTEMDDDGNVVRPRRQNSRDTDKRYIDDPVLCKPTLIAGSPDPADNKDNCIDVSTKLLPKRLDSSHYGAGFTYELTGRWTIRLEGAERRGTMGFIYTF